jgi:uncharacterized membrane protein YgdD (TMEM256/DUF423 family)
MNPSERRNSRRRERWPPPDAISKPGRIAGYTTAGCLVVTSGAFLAASWDDLLCTHDCLFPPGLAALVWFITAPIGLVGIAIARRVSMRPIQTDGSTSWTLSLVILFSGGIAVAATRLPSFTCKVGHLDPNVRLCIEASGHFSDPSNWIWLKGLIAILGLMIAMALRQPKRVYLAAPLAATAWLFGFGWLLLDTVVHGVLR